jgi:hypothetical protein
MFSRFLLAPLGKKERRKERRKGAITSNALSDFVYLYDGSSACLEFATSRPWAGVCFCLCVCACVYAFVVWRDQEDMMCIYLTATLFLLPSDVYF